MEEEKGELSDIERKMKKMESWRERGDREVGRKGKGGQKAQGGKGKKAPCVFLGVITDADLRCHLQHG